MKALAIGLLIFALAACASPVGSPAGSSTAPSTRASEGTTTPSDGTFPSEVAGLPVISVAHAVELLGAGKLDGLAVAVAGYYNEVALPCPFPNRYVGPLESWCRMVAFTDTRAAAQLCQPEGTNGTSCGLPSGTNLSPFFMSETSGDASSSLNGTEPAALVLIGHAGDARQWQCTTATQAECASAFVVDRIAWAAGHDVPPAAPQTGDQQSGSAIAPRMTLAQVAAAAGLGDDLLTAAPFRAGDIATVDPRWNMSGDNVVWLVRSLAPAAGSDAQEARPETVWLVDDATGRVIDSHPLKLAADYQPARLWQMATAHGVGCCSSNVSAFYRVESGDGTVVYEGLVAGGRSSGTDSTTYGGANLSGPPLDLPAGGYSVTAWLATYDAGVMGTPRDECSTHVNLRPLDDVALNADYPSNQACTFGPAPSSSPGS